VPFIVVTVLSCRCYKVILLLSKKTTSRGILK
jgi:hypothetical protein